MPAERSRGRVAGACFAAVVLASGYLLFAPSPPGPPLFPHADKVVHLGLFALLAATARWRFSASYEVLLAVLGYALGSEVVQSLVLPDRSGDPRDLAADTAGALVGRYVAGLLLARSRRRTSGPGRSARRGSPA